MTFLYFELIVKILNLSFIKLIELNYYKYDKFGRTIYNTACETGDVRIVKHILNSRKYFDLNIGNDNEYYGFTLACFFDNIEIIDLLLNTNKFDENIILLRIK